MMQKTITCPLCGHSYSPSEQAACAACPLHSGCSLVCCPACGYKTVDTQQSWLARMASSLLPGSHFVDGGGLPEDHGRREVVIGLETHIQLNTITTKIFCACKADSWNDPPNTNICPVCTGLPGVLPVLNKAWWKRPCCWQRRCTAKSARCHFSTARIIFTRICPRATRSRSTICHWRTAAIWICPCRRATPAGWGIHKLHIEEDAGKTKNVTGRRLIDFNRCGVPLVEMVTGPDLRSSDEAAQYLIRLRQLLRWLGISEADMEKATCAATPTSLSALKARPISTRRRRSKTSTRSTRCGRPLTMKWSARSAKPRRAPNRSLDAGLG
jgi:hypothetical protein